MGSFRTMKCGVGMQGALLKCLNPLTGMGSFRTILVDGEEISTGSLNPLTGMGSFRTAVTANSAGLAELS